MNNFMFKLERKFGRFAVPRLTIIMLICSVIGYVLMFAFPEVMPYLTLDPYQIMHGQVWRLISWILIPPSAPIYLVALILVFYYSIGTTLENTLGAFRYNLYIFGGMFFTVIGSFALLLLSYIFDFKLLELSAEYYFSYVSYYFSMYYINLSVYLAYATLFPESKVMLMFIFPVKIKWLAIVEVVILVYEIFTAFASSKEIGLVVLIAICSSLLNFIIFFISTRKYIRRSKSQVHFRKEVQRSKVKSENTGFRGIYKHKCAICGKTDKDDENMTFRFCSKCDGNYEFCQEHLYTHIHFGKNNENKNN